MKGHMQLREPEDLVSCEEGKEAEIVHLWSQYDGKPLFLDEQMTIFREIEYPIHTQLGRHRFEELFDVVSKWNGANAPHPLSTNGKQAEQLIFFDTETTGLGGGTGNTIFLLGYCHFEGDVVKVKQFFLPGPADEAAFYYYFLDDVNQLSNLVTYNGKAFDWSQVKTRHTLVRDHVPKLPKFGHYDLLHAARRLWKDTLPSCRLSIVEKEILGIERVGDTPGSLAPLLYFDYLKEKDPKLITGVLKHNEIDVLSLIVLYIHLSKKLLDVNHSTSSFKEKYEIARWFEKLQQPEKAIGLYEQVAKSQSSSRDHAMLSLALLLKKDKQLDSAIDYFEILALKETRTSIKAAIELAKVYEHQRKDLERALYYAKQAYEKQKRLARLVSDKKLVSELQVRVERLTKKLCPSHQIIE